MSLEHQPQHNFTNETSGLERRDAGPVIIIGPDEQTQRIFSLAQELPVAIQTQIYHNFGAANALKEGIVEADSIVQRQAETVKGIAASHESGRAEAQSLIDEYVVAVEEFDASAQDVKARLSAKFEKRDELLGKIKAHVEGGQQHRGDLAEKLQAVLESSRSLADDLDSTGRTMLTIKKDKASCDENVRGSRNRLDGLERISNTLNVLRSRQIADKQRDDWARAKFERYQQTDDFMSEASSSNYNEDSVLNSFRQQYNEPIVVEVTDEPVGGGEVQTHTESQPYKEFRQMLDRLLDELDYDPEEIMALGYNPSESPAAQIARLESLLEDNQSRVDKETVTLVSLQSEADRLDNQLRGLMKASEKYTRSFKRLANDDNRELIARSNQLDSEEDSLWRQVKQVNQEIESLLDEARQLEPPRFEAVVTAESAGYKLQQSLRQQFGINFPGGEAAIERVAGNAKFVEGVTKGNIPDGILDEIPSNRLISYVGNRLSSDQESLSQSDNEVVRVLTIAAINAAQERGLLPDLLTNEYLAQVTASRLPGDVAKQLTILACLQAGASYEDAIEVDPQSMEQVWNSMVTNVRQQLGINQQVSAGPVKAVEAEASDSLDLPDWAMAGSKK